MVARGLVYPFANHVLLKHAPEIHLAPGVAIEHARVSFPWELGSAVWAVAVVAADARWLSRSTPQFWCQLQSEQSRGSHHCGVFLLWDRSTASCSASPSRNLTTAVASILVVFDRLYASSGNPNYLDARRYSVAFVSSGVGALLVLTLLERYPSMGQSDALTSTPDG